MDGMNLDRNMLRFPERMREPVSRFALLLHSTI
jgi:hypothetical protein